MSAAPTTWMPLDVGAYLADTMDLSAEYHGAYLLLIMHYWKNRGPIKNDKNSIKNVCKISWKNCEELLQRFFQLEGDFWHHKRIEEELSNATKHKEKKQNQTAAARAAKQGKTGDVTEDVTDLVTDIPSEGRKNHSTSPLPSESKTSTALPNSRAKDEVFNNVSVGKLEEAGSYDILQHLDRIELSVAHASCEGWDIRHLAGIFNENIRTGKLGKPHTPAKAFPAWLRKYTHGKRPS